MNKRLRELMVEADYPAPELALRAQRLAELIVAECLGIVHDAERGGSNEIWDNAVKFIRRDLQEHFGVER